MLPTDTRTLHVTSENVVIDGHPRRASLLLALGDDDRPARVQAVDPDASAIPADTETVALGSVLVVPAPLDIHFHGAGGHVVPPAGDVAAIDETLARVVADAGWQGPAGTRCAYEWVATLPVPQVPAPDPVEHVAACAAAIRDRASATGCIGIRIEGLFLNPARAGVWPPETFRAPDTGLLDELHAAARDNGSSLLVLDLAPELAGALELVERCGELGIVASLAHTDATWDQARTAIDAGARLATHTWNAMRPVSHRDPGVVAACLTDDRVTCELICDGVHLHPGTISMSTRASGAGRWIAVSDASPFAGCAPGAYDWAGTTVHHDGRALRDDAGHLAGSASLLDAAWSELIQLGEGALTTALALGAGPRGVLEPDRGQGVEVGDPVWVVAAT